jgi:DNA-directed RNA polymerase specialized sigma24 family protein
MAPTRWLEFSVRSSLPTRQPSSRQFQELLDSLEDSTLQQIALWRMDGLSNSEIAWKMGCVIRTVERKIERIRLIWEDIGASPHD